ncbi:glutamate-rich protein 6-like [Osmerus mordax]|uniref:glutamate-rich protein 6-like n=1 Tax=Osmerus mordax TaxID=8014 RepID=UPI00350E99C1
MSLSPSSHSDAGAPHSKQHDIDDLPDFQPLTEKVQSATIKNISPECIEVHALDGRAITIVSTNTQTDWEWVEQKLSDSCQVQSKIENFEPEPEEKLLTHLVDWITSPDTENEETDVDVATGDEKYDIPVVGPPSLLAYKPESKQPSVLFKKGPEVSTTDSPRKPSEGEEFVLCDYCQQPSKPFISREELENNPDLEFIFCCERAVKMREFLLEKERALAAVEANRKIDVGPHPPFMSKKEKRVAKERADQRLREWELQRVQKTGNQNRFFSGGMQIKTISYRLSNEVWIFHEEPHFPYMDIIDTSNFFTLQKETDARHRRKHVILRLYPDGKPFIALYPDGTGNVFYPSGKAAIIISSVKATDITYIIMEDKDSEPKMLAILTTKSQSTCYHPNGLIWVNLTAVGGCCCSETGALRRRWSWLDLEPQIQAPPFQPICLGLNSNVSLRIQTQDRIFLAFSSRQHRVRFNVGSKLKLTHPEGLLMPGPDTLQRHLQMKSLEIYSLLDRIQTCMAYQHSENPHHIKPQYSLIAQMQRLRRQMEKLRSPQRTKALMASK